MEKYAFVVRIVIYAVQTGTPDGTSKQQAVFLSHFSLLDTQQPIQAPLLQRHVSIDSLS